MSLTAGTRLGTHEIVRLLGVGGMGEVYHARDTRLGREIALKVLPGKFARDAERLARFEREAE
jgi:serine/threonine protein kinase